MLQGLKEIFLKFDTDKASGQDTSFFKNMIYHVNTEIQLVYILCFWVGHLFYTPSQVFHKHEDTETKHLPTLVFQQQDGVITLDQVQLAIRATGRSLAGESF